jgi:hypothetical protein
VGAVDSLSGAADMSRVPRSGVAISSDGTVDVSVELASGMAGVSIPPMSKERSPPISKDTSLSVPVDSVEPTQVSEAAVSGGSQISSAISFSGSFGFAACSFCFLDSKSVSNSSAFFSGEAAAVSEVFSFIEPREDPDETISFEWSLPSLIVTGVFLSRKRLSKSHIKKKKEAIISKIVS